VRENADLWTPRSETRHVKADGALLVAFRATNADHLLFSSVQIVGAAGLVLGAAADRK
jgi:hypothetical protein